MVGISSAPAALLVTLPSPAPAGQADSSPVVTTRLADQDGGIRVPALGSTAIADAMRKAVRPSFTAPSVPMAFRNRRANRAAGIALIVAGTGMVVVNSIGLSSGTTVPPGGPRDGYLGAPGVVIGSALVITGVVLLVRSR